MARIDHGKLGFASFPGYSILFDPPNSSDLQLKGTNFLSLHCGANDFYQALKDSLATLSDVRALCAAGDFFPLPLFSYHVTIWNGLNYDNLQKVKGTPQSGVEDFLFTLPESLRNPPSFVDLALQSPLVTENLDITFQFDRLAVGRNARVLKANLKVVAEEEDSTYDKIKGYQRQLRNDFEKKFGVKDYGFDPHISLGYFSNYDISEDAKSKVKQWSDDFGNRMGTRTITYTTASLYGFRDMVNFYKRA